LARFGVPLLILAVTRLILPVYGVIAFVLVVGRAGYYRSKPRLLVPSFSFSCPRRSWPGVLARAPRRCGIS
jgi:hypothetical protein